MPIVIIGRFAMLAIGPVAPVVIGTLHDARLRALRWWAADLAVAYAAPSVRWAIGPGSACGADVAGTAVRPPTANAAPARARPRRSGRR